MMKNYTYPHVGIKTTVISRRAAQEQVEDKVTLFVPFQSDIGPTNQILRFHSLSDFTATYGDLNYSKQGETACIIRNWLLNNYGTVYACRLFDTTKAKASFSAEFVIRDVEKKEVSDFNYIEVPRKQFEEADKSLNIPAGLKYVALPGIDGVIDFDSSTGLDGLVTIDDVKEKATHFYFPVAKGTDDKGKPIYSVDTEIFGTEYSLVFINGANEINIGSREKVEFTAKYNGVLYNTLEMNFTFYKTGYTRVSSKLDGALIDSRNIQNTTLTGFASTVNFLEKFDIGEVFIALSKLVGLTVKLGGAEDDDERDLNAAVKAYFSGDLAFKHLANRLECPVNMIMDPGYTPETKQAVASFINDSLIKSGRRDDFMFIISRFTAKISNKKFTGRMDLGGDNSGELTFDSTTIKEENFNSEYGNFVIYDQYFTVEEALAGSGTDSISIQVTPSYFLSTLIPRNDHLYGIQYPVAGLTRGTITGVLSMNENFDPDTKQAKFDAEYNYVEKDSRGYHFMSQRTHNSARANDVISPLSFFNNVRVRNLITREIEQLGREYLFEFNDAITLNNMSNVLNQYINNWVQNRTLQEGYVIVEADEYSSERINVTIYMKFTGTIETISVNIILE